MNSDVTVFFLEILPRIASGVLVQIHDIFLTWDYRPVWVDRHYSEQYLLAAWLLGGSKDAEVVLANFYIFTQPELAAILDRFGSASASWATRPQGTPCGCEKRERAGVLVMALDRGAAWRAWTSYRGCGMATQAFLLARMAVAPLGPLEPELRQLRGRLLSLGCGYGAVDRYVAELNPEVTIDGIELDRDRVEAARATQDRCPRVAIRAGDALAVEVDGDYDGALVIDLLHHLPAEGHVEVARALCEAIRPGGVCLVKDMATTPRYQYLWNRMHDRIVSGPYLINCRTPDDMAEVFSAGGFDIAKVRRLPRLHLYPQYLVRAVKPGGGAGQPARRAGAE